jgi:hypothetical protein
MRSYIIHRFGDKVRYAQLPTNSIKVACAYIPNTVPKMLDPFLLWKETSKRAHIKHLEIQDSQGSIWFELKCATPIEKFMDLSVSVLKEMR